MKNNAFKYIALAILIGGGYFIYTRVSANKSNSNVDDIINSGSGTNKMFLQTLDPAYIKAWADAINSNATTFTFGTKKYNVKGGKAIK